MIAKVLLETEEVIVDHHLDSREMIAKVLLEKKVERQVNPPNLKKNLMVIKKNPLKNLQKNSDDLGLKYV